MNRKKLFIICIIFLVLAAIAVTVYFLDPYRGVSEFGPLKLGMPAPFTPEDRIALFYEGTPPPKFYVYAMQKGLRTNCIYEECGMSGVLVGCMGGWITGSGEKQPEGANMFGLKLEEVQAGKSSMVIVEDKDAKVIGIYPNRTTNNIPTILKKHSGLSKYMDECFDYHMPRRYNF